MLDKIDWDSFDTSDIFDELDVVPLEIIRHDIECTYCGSGRVRTRLVDRYGIKKIKVIYCPDCKKEKTLLKICGLPKCAKGLMVV